MTAETDEDVPIEETRGRYSFHGALFRADILELGVEGFSNWLVNSFSGSEPTPQLGRFQYTEDPWFSDAIAIVADEFEPKVADIVRRSTEIAIERFSREHLETGTYLGLLILISMADEFNVIKAATPSLARILNAWLPTRGTLRKWPQHCDDVMAMRDILECVYRQLTRCIDERHSSGPRTPIPARKLSEFAEICRWSKDFLVYRRYARDLIPSLAPIYFLALVQYVVFDQARVGFDQFDDALRGGAYRNGDANSALYEFQSEKFEGRRFPYDIDSILKNRSTFVNSLTGAVRPIEPVNSLCNSTDPFSPDKLLATSGGNISNRNAKELIELLNEEASA